MKIVGIFAVIALVIYCGYKAYSTANVDADLSKHLKQNPIILDVRTVSEFSGGHIAGAVNIPLSQLKTSALSALTGKRPIITCCSHGLRSIKAVEVLKKRGFTHVYNGGAWTELEGKLAVQK
ncbi:phage shock protein E [Mucilaginibacter gracilis]|uniref:Phage shock protein E n=1 Tax=Mucilaginibacter gracilis TaxID=423350 RepID=A0A495J3E6_9SPHI|nr:rhodanese-like domain-containing protein [Mucilaginibacter gracilis]RKR82898.1 phage shock protein E [Mucilaginibacter gracilis]